MLNSQNKFWEKNEIIFESRLLHEGLAEPSSFLQRPALTHAARVIFAAVLHTISQLPCRINNHFQKNGSTSLIRHTLYSISTLHGIHLFFFVYPFYRTHPSNTSIGHTDPPTLLIHPSIDPSIPPLPFSPPYTPSFGFYFHI